MLVATEALTATTNYSIARRTIVLGSVVFHVSNNGNTQSVSESSLAWFFPFGKQFQTLQNMESQTHSDPFSLQATRDCGSRLRGVALQAAGLELSGRFLATASSLERAARQAGGFCTNSASFAFQADGLECDAARTQAPEVRHSPVASLETQPNNNIRD
jgi:hypothetical protein